MILYENGNTTQQNSGTNLTLTNTIEAPLKIDLYGNTSQSGTPTPSSPQNVNVVSGNNTIKILGKNICDYATDLRTNYNGLTSVLNEDGSITTTGVPTSNYVVIRTYDITDMIEDGASYTLNVGSTDTYIRLQINAQKIGGGTDYFNTGGVRSKTFVADSTKYNKYVLQIVSNTTAVWGSSSRTITHKYQLEKNTTYTDFEKYKEQEYDIDLRTGKNLFDKNTTPFVSGKYLTSNGSQTSSNEFSIYKIAIQPNTTYTLTNSGSSNAPSLCYYNKYGTYIDGFSYTNRANITFTTPSNARYIEFSVVTQSSSSRYDLNIFQIEKGEEATTYEAYNTIELCKIGDYKDKIYYQSNSKNLFNKNTIETGHYVKNDGTLGNSNNYLASDYIIVNGMQKVTTSGNTDIRVDYASKVAFYTSDKTFISYGDIAIGSNTYTIPSNAYYMRITCRNTDLNNTQVEEGETATSYQPFGEGWFKQGYVKKLVFDGTENWVLHNSNTNRNVFRIAINDKIPYTSNTDIPKMLSNHFIPVANNSTWVVGNLSEGAGSSNVYFAVATTYTLDTYKTWLLNNNVNLYYVLSTPTYTRITDETLISQLDNLKEATSYRDTTNITQSNNDLSFNMDVLSYTNPLDLTRNGLGYLPNVLSAYVVDAINGEYSLTFEYPMNDAMSDEIKEGRIVKCKVADGSNQCFIIKNIEKTYEKMVVKCTHLFYMLLEDFIDDSYPQNLSPKPFLDWLLHRMNYPLPFTTTSNVATTKTGRYVRRNMVDIILGDSDNSMKNLFGIELERDNWNIGLKARIGADHGEKLIYGKNINGINVSIDDTGVYTRIMPIGFDGLLLPEEYVDAPNINDYPYPRICLYSFPNIKYDPNDAEAYHTQEEAYQALRDATNELYENKINYPKININIDWLELSKTEEYKNYSALERVHLGDTITSNIFGMDYETRVIQTTYNPLNDRVEGFEIGTFQPTFTSYTTKLSEQVKEVNPESILAEAQANATNLINSAMGGYVYKTNSELYIMDTDDPSTAQKVWRWNINGLGYSSTGIAGPYGLAMTMDGQIVADFITTGQLNTGVIEGYDSLVTTVNGNGIKIDNNYQELLGMFDNYTPTSTTTELQSTVTNIQTNTYTKQQIDTKLVDGSVQKVMTVSGTFDMNGMHYEKNNANTSTTINEVGVGVNKTDGTDDYILFAGYVDSNNTQYSDYEGQTIVASENILVKNYLVIGNNSRMENYENGTGVFYIGG